MKKEFQKRDNEKFKKIISKKFKIDLIIKGYILYLIIGGLLGFFVSNLILDVLKDERSIIALVALSSIIVFLFTSFVTVTLLFEKFNSHFGEARDKEIQYEIYLQDYSSYNSDFEPTFTSLKEEIDTLNKEFTERKDEYEVLIYGCGEICGNDSTFTPDVTSKIILCKTSFFAI